MCTEIRNISIRKVAAGTQLGQTSTVVRDFTLKAGGEWPTVTTIYFEALTHGKYRSNHCRQGHSQASRRMDAATLLSVLQMRK